GRSAQGRRGQRITMLVLPADPPHLRPEKPSNLLLVLPADVEQKVRHPRIVMGQPGGPGRPLPACRTWLPQTGELARRAAMALRRHPHLPRLACFAGFAAAGCGRSVWA